MRKSKAFLAKLDKLNYRRRWATIVAMVRDSDAAAIESMQIELENGTVFQQFVSLQISIVTQNVSRVLNCLKSESRMLSMTAAAASLKFCTDEPEFVEAIVKAPYSIQRQLIRGVGRSGNVELAEGVLAKLIALGPRTVAKLLPSCSLESITEHLPDCEIFVSAWPQLVKQCPAVVGEYIHQQFSKSVVSQHRSLWYRFSKAIVAIAALDEPLVVSLFEKYCPNVTKLNRNLQRLLMRLYASHSETLGRLILSKQSLKEFSRSGVPQPFVQRTSQFADQHLQVLVETLLPKAKRLVPLFNRLAPSRRRKILQAIDVDVTLSSGVSEAFLLTLPNEIRKREASRIFELDGDQMHQSRKVSLHAMLDYQTALPVLEKAFKSAKAEERAAGYTHLVKCAALNRCLGEALEVLQRTANEQEPVRTAYLKQLQACRQSVFQDDHAPLLESLIQSALEARDSSNSTFSTIQGLLLKFMMHCDRDGKLYRLALKYLQEVGRRSGGIHLPWSVSDLPAGREFDLVESLAGLMRGSNKEERYELTLQLAGRLGRRGWQVPRLEEMLAEVLDAQQTHHRQSAIQLWLDNPATRDQRIEKLLKSDLSVITQWRVLNHLHLQRQDLLDPFLKGSTIKGKFLSGKTVYLLPVTQGFYRWLPRQQVAFATLLDRYTGRKEASNRDKYFAISAKANLTVSTLEDFSKELASDDVVTLEATLGAIPSLDRIGEGADVLASHLDSDRARVAMYALPRCMKEMSGDSRLTILKKLVGPGKVTVRKEAVRLLGRYSSAESMAVLNELLDSENLHRDVKIAVVHAAVESLHQESAWDLLQRLAADENEDLCVSLLDADASCMNRSQRMRFGKLLLPLVNHVSPKVRYAFFVQSMRWQTQLAEPFAEAAASRILQIEPAAPESQLAASCLARCCDDERAGKTIAQTIEKLASPTDEANALAERDCPSLQRLRYLVSQIVVQPPHVRSKLSSDVVKTAQRLMKEVRTLQVGSELFLAAVQWDSDDCVSQLDSLGQSLETDLVMVGEFLKFFGRHLRNQEFSLDESMLPIVKSLGESNSTVSRMLSIVMLCEVGGAMRWPPECRAQLVVFRGDQEATARRLAFSVFTKSE